MIAARATMEGSRCESCGGPSDNPDIAEIVTLVIGRERNVSIVLLLCHRCIEHELLPAAAPWAVR